MYREVPCDFSLSFFFYLSERTKLHFSRFNPIFAQIIACAIGQIFFVTNFAGPSRARKSEVGERGGGGSERASAKSLSSSC